MNSGTKMAYFDCYSGISGDMALGGLLDCGLELSMLQDFLSGLKLDGYHLSRKQVKLYGLTGTKLTVNTTGPEPPSRHLADIEKLIEQSSLPAPSGKVSGYLTTACGGGAGSPHAVHFYSKGGHALLISPAQFRLHPLGIDNSSVRPTLSRYDRPESRADSLPLLNPGVIATAGPALWLPGRG